ncbi:ubiquitin carboxyl-terminal hydrolase 30 homolog [Penaeus indicus]|uniref:ubiquitin carboxyl-terminal hydrolase 30 homolog n=1 Tax=Penaeus indicus TaxID=29960 RepID=UPI00300D68FB
MYVCMYVYTHVYVLFIHLFVQFQLPDCLCFHVKRTIWLENGTAIKRRDHVIFPEFLTMDPYTYTTSITAQVQQDSLRDSSDHSHSTSERNGGSNLSSDWSANNYDHQSLSILSKHATSSQLEPSSFVHVSRVRCEQLYRLKAVIVHVGDVFCGHFVTYRRGAIGSRTRNRWFYASDLLVREATLEEVKKAHIYMILYEKVTQ